LAQRDRVHLAAKDRLHTLDPSPTDDPLLDLVLAELAAKEGKHPAGVLPKLGTDLKEAVYVRLAEQGLVTRNEGKIFGLIKDVSWPPSTPQREQRIEELASVLRGDQTPSDRTGALIALLHVCDLTWSILGDPSGLSRKEVRAKAKEIASGEWASAAVKDAVTGAQGAIAATMIAVGVVTTAGS
ncbi:MAG: GPP34 family phosphoprotein, partial [Ornithinimicrobium sp.]